MKVTTSDRNAAIVATRFFAQSIKRTFQQKVHSSVSCFKNTFRQAKYILLNGNGNYDSNK